MSKLLTLFLIFCIQFIFTKAVFNTKPDANIDETAVKSPRCLDSRKPYIVYMGEVPEETTLSSLANEHQNLLEQVLGNKKLVEERKIHSYGQSINAFAACLSKPEADQLRHKEGIISVFESRIQKLRTTRSWDFLGVSEKLTKRNHKTESDLIIGVLDTGIDTSIPSFSDKGFGPPPKRWKGICQKGANFTGCNKKVIGARFFNLDKQPDEPTPADTEGHGTHTASTAAGNVVKGASLFGLAKGTARGGVPSARIAVYKVCWSYGCADLDLLAAFDAAIADGVDLISISIGGPSRSFFEDTMAIGSFHTMSKGILTVSAGGNSGPHLFSVENVAPWMFTIAATGIDRKFETIVKLGNGYTASGNSLNTFSLKKRKTPLISGALAANSSEAYPFSGNSSNCDSGTLIPAKVKGKIVLCFNAVFQDDIIQQLGGAGTIMVGDVRPDTPFPFLIPASVVEDGEGVKIDKYINNTKLPMAIIYKSTTKKIPAPFIASFSAVGPQLISPNILKPDIAAPGIAILAGYPGNPTISGNSIDKDKRHSQFNIISGTSMATPHAAAAAAYVKSFHPAWSPAAVKSALMTTATPMKIRSESRELAEGAGQINPIKARNPGLVFDITKYDYIKYLCKEGYNDTTIRLLTGGKKRFNCASMSKAKGEDGLNYPSIHLQLLTRGTKFSATFVRTVKNLSGRKATYILDVSPPKDVVLIVTPKILRFDPVHQTRSFKVVMHGSFRTESSWLLSGSITWKDARHNVRVPIAIYRPNV